MEVMSIVWLGLMILFLVVEAACPLHLVSIWFAAGSLVGLLASRMGFALWLQVALFLVTSCALLASLWPIAKKYFTPRLTATNVDSVIGSTGYVTAEIDNVHARGQVKLDAMEWTARSTNGEPIPQGALIRVDRVEGVKVFVTALKVPENV